jgi:hypothetical protein
MRKTIAAGALLAASVILGIPAAAYAAGPAACSSNQQTSGNGYGLLNNLQIGVPVSLGLNITDNALGLLGYGSANRTAGDTSNC